MAEMKEPEKLPYVLFEVANTHGGDEKVIFEIIKEFQKIPYPRKGIKFQPLKPDLLALPDFSWYNVYQELFFSSETWKAIISSASRNCGEVWLDIFDTYGVDIYTENQQLIEGLKLQASVLDNLDVTAGLSAAGLEQKRLIINISGYEISEIEYYLEQFQKMNASELILQIGFQAYPTDVSDTGLQKIAILKAAHPEIPICFADHSPAELPISREIPVWAFILGCSTIEKHFCIKRSDAKYDHYSSLEPEEMKLLLKNLKDWCHASRGLFISKSERDYLEKSYQAVVARHDIFNGSMIGLSDIIFRRTAQSGLKWSEIVSLQSRGFVLSDTVVRNATVSKYKYKKAIIGVIVACRMKSSRLKNKAILPINGIPSVERCLQNCLKIDNVDVVVLATSDLPEDAILEKHTAGGKARFWKGDADDVIRRYLEVCDHFHIDVIIRVTADCPVVSKEIAEILLKSHFESGSDYTCAASSAVGSAIEVYNAEALRRVIKYLGEAKHSEYMTWYMKNNPDIFKLNIVDLPQSLYREYRLTLDYEEDLKMFNHLFLYLDQRGLDPTLINIFNVLDENPAIPAINQNMPLRYKTDQVLIEMLNKVTKIHKK